MAVIISDLTFLNSFMYLCTFVFVGRLRYCLTYFLFLFLYLESTVLHFSSWAPLFSCSDTHVCLLHLGSSHSVFVYYFCVVQSLHCVILWLCGTKLR